MHGLICRSFEGFVRAAYGASTWREAMHALDVGIDSFEPMFHYDDDLVERLVVGCAGQLGKPVEALLEDFGTFLVAGSPQSRVRRLLRFGGVDFDDFLHSLEDLPGRAALAVPDIGLPALHLAELEDGALRLSCCGSLRGAGHVAVGLLRALADDYGALALLEHRGRKGRCEEVAIHLLKTDYSEGRGFDLADGTLAMGARAP